MTDYTSTVCTHVTITTPGMLAYGHFLGPGMEDAGTTFRGQAHIWFDENVTPYHDEDLCDQFNYSYVVVERNRAGDVFMLTVQTILDERWVFTTERIDPRVFPERWEDSWQPNVLVDRTGDRPGLRFFGTARWEG